MISDPFELAGLSISGRIAAHDDKALLVELNQRFRGRAREFGWAVLSLRTGLDWNSAGYDVNGLGLIRPDWDAPRWGVEEWRGGGLAFIGTVIPA